MKITKVRVFELVGGKRNELSIFEIYHPYLSMNSDGEDCYRQLFTQIDTDEGVSGLCMGGSKDVLEMGQLLIGEDPWKTELLWEKLYFSRYVRFSGMQAIAILDIALWDLKGKIVQQPVHRLLGGCTRTEIPTYAAMLGYIPEPNRAAEVSAYWVEQGYRAVKWYIQYSAADGLNGFKKNVEVIEAVRTAVGDDVDIIVDFGVSSPQKNTAPYIQNLAKEYERLGVLWLEEPFAFDDLKAYAQLREKTPLQVALGERWYNRWQFRDIIETRAASILQPDPYFAMGITEVRKIVDLASAYGLPVIPHANESFRYCAHLLFATPERVSPMAEYGIKTNANFQYFFEEPYEPVNGMLHVPTGVGFGSEIDWGKVKEKNEL